MQIKKAFVVSDPKIDGRLICSYELPKRCRKVAVLWMDGILYCEDHKGKVPVFLRDRAKPIRFQGK